MTKNLYEVIFQRQGCEEVSVKVLGVDPKDAQYAAVSKLDDGSYGCLHGGEIISITRIAEDIDYP